MLPLDHLAGILGHADSGGVGGAVDAKAAVGVRVAVKFELLASQQAAAAGLPPSRVQRER